MNILHVLEDYSYLNGGVKTFVSQLHSYINTHTNHNSFIFSPNCEPDVNLFPQKAKKVWRYIPNINAKFDKVVRDAHVDIIHIHGIWMYPQLAAAHFAKKNNIPFIISLHGMLRPDIHKKSTFKKNLYLNLFLRTIFSSATAIHTITKEEQQEFLGDYNQFSKKTFCINNYIEMEEKINLQPLGKVEPYLLYLGRLTEIKRIDVLLHAVAKLPNGYPRLLIAGEKNAYYKELLNIVERLNIGEKVTFVGHVSGQEKEKLYQNAVVFIAPSKSEVVGMVNLEAVNAGTLVIASNNAGLDSRWVENGALLINPEVEEIVDAIKAVVSLKEKDRLNRINKLRNFVFENYSWQKKGSTWIRNYIEIMKTHE